MVQHDPSWTGRWVSERIQERDEVTTVELLHPQILRIVREDETSFIVATLSSACVDADDIQGLLNHGHRIDMFVNTLKEAYWTGAAIRCLASAHAAFGGMSDLQRVITQSVPHDYVNPEFAFVERGLRQHTRVTGLTRFFDRKYSIQRLGLNDVVVVLLNEYELTAEHVRTARDRYGDFGAILITNPNGRATSAADEAAQSMGVGIFKWGAFLGRLNRG